MAIRLRAAFPKEFEERTGKPLTKENYVTDWLSQPQNSVDILHKMDIDADEMVKDPQRRGLININIDVGSDDGAAVIPTVLEFLEIDLEEEVDNEEVAQASNINWVKMEKAFGVNSK